MFVRKSLEVVNVIYVDPIQKTIQALKKGAVVAIKGLGGFHLAVDAASEDGVQRLRARKLREEKPFAVMVKDVATAKSLAQVSRAEEDRSILPLFGRGVVMHAKFGDTAVVEDTLLPRNRSEERQLEERKQIV